MYSIEIDQRKLYSAFQPIYSFSNQACVGAEALIRGEDLTSRQAIPVAHCLSVPHGLTKNEFTKKINHLHLKNWQGKTNQHSWLFINLDFQMLDSLEDLCLQELLDELHVCGKDLVVEVVESEIVDEVLFENLIKKLRSLGCLIALDDFGAGHSNVDRIWKAQPDIVKLDRQVLLEATKNLRSESILRNLTHLIKQSGSIPLLEGIETKEQAMLAMDAGVDLVQGFYFATPQREMAGAEKGEMLLCQITDSYPEYRAERQFIVNIQKKGYETLFECLTGLDSAHDLETEMIAVSSLSFVKRFFILDMHGYQISEEHPELRGDESEQAILKKGKGLCWKNRRYFIKAVSKPNDIYVSRPYRSLIDVELCVTVSKVIQLNDGQQLVACYDAYYHDKSTSSIQISI